MVEQNQTRGRLLRGARELAAHVLGDENQWRAIYALAPELPVFRLGGRIAGYTRSLDEAMARKEGGEEPTATQARRSAKLAREREAV